MVFTCKICGREFARKNNMKRHKKSVHDRIRADTTTRKNESTTAPERPPDGPRAVVLTKTAGDLVPWTGNNNLLLLSPAVICGIVVPRNWSSDTARGMAGLDRNLLQQYRRHFHPVLAEAERVARERAAAARDRADEVIDDSRPMDVEDQEEEIVIVDSDSDWEYI